MVAAWSIAHGNEKEHAESLTRGLARLPHDFMARVCPLCEGEGRRRQRYCDGPNGAFTMMGGCDYCDGTGLLQGNSPAPSSVRSQVLAAAEATKLVD
jgi:DnaJ-class molecular chaperone